jgi:molybdenum cofactor cytidylyltransferase
VPFKEKIHQISAILLAAGGSSRLGQPKQLIHFRNELLINYIINQIKKGGIQDIKVVLGSRFKEIREQITNKEITIIENANWKEGISSSIKIGLGCVNINTEAVIFFIVDQPYLDYKIIRILVEKYQTSRATIIATKAADQLIHPVLYRREVFPKLLGLEGDVGGKAIFEKEVLETVDWPDDRLLMDIDSSEDLENLE